MSKLKQLDERIEELQAELEQAIKLREAFAKTIISDEHLRYPVQNVHDAAKRAGITEEEASREIARVERKYRTETADLVSRMKADYKNGATMKSIAEKYNVALGRVSFHCRKD